MIIALIVWNHQHYPIETGSKPEPASSLSTTLDKTIRTGVPIKIKYEGQPTSTVTGDAVFVARAVDGDTIELANGEKVRYIGMDTPETVDPRKPVGCYGHEASAYNKQLVEGKEVVLAKDLVDKDKYGRLLRYVYLIDGTFVNLQLVQNGFARVLTIPPNDSLSTLFIQAAHEAQAAKKGLWSACH